LFQHSFLEIDEVRRIQGDWRYPLPQVIFF
jgi:hypothetical protein